MGGPSADAVAEDFEETHGKCVLRIRKFTHPDGCKYFNVMVGRTKTLDDGRKVFAGVLRMGEIADGIKALQDFEARMMSQEIANAAIKRQKSAEYKQAVEQYKENTDKRLGKKGRKKIAELKKQAKENW